MRGKIKPYFAFFAAIIALILSFSAFAASGNGDLIVYITQTGGRYHSDGCASLSRSKYEITLEEAIIEGYTPCDRCNPPIYTGDAVPYETKHVSQGGSGTSSSINRDYTKETEDLWQKYTARSERETHQISPARQKKSVNFDHVFNLVFLGIVVVFPLSVSVFFRIQEAVQNIPFVKKRKEQKLAEEQRKKEIEEQEKRKPLVSKMFSESDRQKQIFFDALLTFTDRCSSTKIPENNELVALQDRLSYLLQANNAYIKNWLIYKSDGEYFGDDCTVYYSPGGSRYHLVSCPYRGDYYNHILCPPQGYLPCSKCRPNKKDLSWMYEIRQTQQRISDIEDSNRLLECCKSEKIASLQSICEKMNSQLFVLGNEKVRFMDHLLNK